ncbi:hypothetical protein Tcan_15001 [Toxocara canis]|uniref:Uncharacterized protein n=1 Tax=Toxocara canis TaxID=6265 RepID=A0A0B2V024_TOXCA|nr:hypothetical protein Tcan_15001 [Toxocara canis]
MEKSIANSTRVVDVDGLERSAKVDQLSIALNIAAHSTPTPPSVARTTITLPQTMPLSTDGIHSNPLVAGHPSTPITNGCGMHVDLERSIRRFERYGQIYADSPKSHMNVEKKTLGMPGPPHGPPPPPPPPPLPSFVPFTPPTSSSLHSSQKVSSS